MLTLEATWHDAVLLVWGHAPDGLSVCAESLRDFLGQACGDALLASGATGQSVHREGGADVQTLRFAPDQAADFLLSLPHDGRLGDSARFFVTLGRFVLDRVEAGQFYPSIDIGSGDRAFATWRPLVNGTNEVAWLRVMAQRLPAEARILLPVDAPQEAWEQNVESFVSALTDALVRRATSEDPFFARAADKCRLPDATDDMRWMAGLLAADRLVEDPTPHMIDAIRQWTSVLELWHQGGAMRLAFELIEPDEDTEPWRVRFQLDPADSDAEPIEASTLWESGQTLPAILGRTLLLQRQLLLEELTRAGDTWPVLKRLDDPAPCEVEINSAEAIAFIRQWAPRLREAGFAARLPDWAQDSPRKITIQMALRPAAADEPDPLAEGTGRVARSTDPSETGSGQMGLGALLEFDWQIAIGDLRLSDDQFREILSRQQQLVRVDGQWVEVDTDAAEKAMQFLQENRQGNMTLGDALRIAHGTTPAETGLEISGLVGSQWIQQLLRQTPDVQVEELAQPTGFKGELRPYQLRGLQWMAFLQRLGIGACLADDMGLGKTIQLISLLLLEREVAQKRVEAQGGTTAHGVGPTLLFAPTSVLSNWVREVARFAPNLKTMAHHGTTRLHGEEFRQAVAAADLVITSYALATRDIEDLKSINWHRMVLDEAQKIKNPSAGSTLSIRSIPASHRIAMTGTPIENHLSELWSIMEILNPGLMGTASSFRERFAVPIERLGDASRGEHLRSFLRPFVLRRTKSDPTIAGDLPEKMELPVYCNLTVEQASLYQRITDEMLGQIDSASGIRRRGLILAALTRLKQICDHPMLLAGKVAGASISTETDGRSGKCERLVEMLEEVVDVGDNALVFTQFKAMGDILEQVLTKRLGVPVLYLHGGTPAARRDTMVQQFQDPASGVRIFLLSLRAGGLGLNLTRANHVFHFDRWWNPAVEQQATDRAHRIGQTRTVQVHKYICIGTMEERIDRLLKEKVDLADRIVTSGDAWLTGLSTDELRKTLALSDEAVEDYQGNT